MNTELATIHQESAAVAVEVTALAWATKAGKAKAAYTERAQAAAPATVRFADAQAKTLAALNNGRYVAFCRDAVAALTAGHKKALNTHLNMRYAAMLANVSAMPGVTATVDVDALATVGQVDKAMFRPIAEFLASPQAETKKVVSDKPLAKSHAWISAVAAEWLKAQQA